MNETLTKADIVKVYGFNAQYVEKALRTGKLKGALRPDPARPKVLRWEVAQADFDDWRMRAEANKTYAFRATPRQIAAIAEHTKGLKEKDKAALRKSLGLDPEPAK